MNYKDFVKTHQQKIVLATGYILVALLAFGLGRTTAFKYSVPDIKIEEVFAPPSDTNYNPNPGTVQSTTVDNSKPDDCNGKIKGNISSSNKIYHMPGGSFYNRTNAEMCFETEAEAKAAGFRKSSR